MAINSALVGEVVSQSALTAFNDALTPMVGAFATDFGGEIGSNGQVVKVPVYNGYSAGSFAGDYTTNASNDVGAVTVTVNKHLYKTVSLTDLEVSNNGAGATRVDQIGRKLGEALALGVYQDVLSLVTAANFGTATAFTGTSTGFDSDDIVDIKTVCDAADMPKAGRAVILSDAYYNALLKDTSVKNAQNYGTTEGIQAGMIPNLAGFGVWQTNAVPNNSENLVGIACVQDAIAIAMRYLAPQMGHGYIRAEALTAPQTGVTLGVREWYDESKGTKYLTLEANYGYSVGIAAGLKRILSA
jgi:hypothetical protein